jgi:hypothetical protein
MVRHLILSTLIAALAAFSITQSAQADSEKPAGAEVAKKTRRKTDKEASKETTEASPSPAKRRDPFVVPSRVKREPKIEVKKGPLPVPAPSVDARLTEYRSAVRAASATGRSAPDKLSPYLVDELTVTGIFRNSAGYGAFVAAGPTKMTFFVRAGMRTYDGLVKEVTPTGVKFVKNTRFDDGSTRQTEEFRALRSGK